MIRIPITAAESAESYRAGLLSIDRGFASNGMRAARDQVVAVLRACADSWCVIETPGPLHFLHFRWEIEASAPVPIESRALIDDIIRERVWAGILVEVVYSEDSQ